MGEAPSFGESSFQYRVMFSANLTFAIAKELFCCGGRCATSGFVFLVTDSRFFGSLVFQSFFVYFCHPAPPERKKERKKEKKRKKERKKERKKGRPPRGPGAKERKKGRKPPPQ